MTNRYISSAPRWLIRLCRHFWQASKFFWTAIVLGVAVNILGAFLFTNLSFTNLLKETPLGWVFQNPSILISIGTLLLSLTSLVGLVGRLGEAPGIERSYLTYLIRGTERITLHGIPAGLISESVRLADVYIPPLFYANRLLVDFPLSEAELESYRHVLALKEKRSLPELERVILVAEKNWYHVLRKDELLGLDVLWQRLRASSAVVIQGYPGMGKSTLMERLTLHMAARGLHRPDLEMPEQKALTPVLLPLLLHLGSYAIALERSVDSARFDLPAYLLQEVEKLEIPGLSALFQQRLWEGTCLVLLDGLDEVSQFEMRARVQVEIRELVNRYSRCRFIITSRMAGYDQAAFPAFPHFTLAELTNEQVEAFLPRWCRANLNRELLFKTTQTSASEIEQESARRVSELQAAIESNPGVRDMTSNPFLLILQLVMQTNSILLPTQRVELYDMVTRTLLEHRSIAKHLPPINTLQALTRLGPLAFRMQEENRTFVHQRVVEKELEHAILCEGNYSREVALVEARNFLQLMRERSGLFVMRVGDHFGFIHRCFQEYFAARYMLNNIEIDQERSIDELVQRALRQDSVWREPFLLAVAYQSKTNEVIASKILHALLSNASKDSFEQEISAILLTVDAIIEAGSSRLEAWVQKETAERLLTCYERSQWIENFSICRSIEDLMGRWLGNEPNEAYRLPLLDVISQTIKDTRQIAHQRSVLLLLLMIADRLAPCPPLLLQTLTPLILALTGLSSFVDNSYDVDPSLFLDPSLADLAIPLLSLVGSREPGGIFVEWLSRQGTKALVSYASGIIAQKKGQHELAQNLYNESVLAREQVSDPNQRAGILYLEGMIVHSQRLYDDASSLFEESLRAVQKTEDRKLQASTLYWLGLIAQEKGIYREAQRLYEESLALKPNEVEPIIGLNELCFLLREPGNIASIDILERVLSNLKRYINKEDNPNAQRRPEEQKIWQWLYEIIQDINTVQTSRSLLKRTTALNHAVGLLADPPQGTDISQVGKLLIKRVIDRWSTEIAHAATRLGKLSVTEYVGSPYMFTPPVTGKALIGRDDIFKRITSLWARPGQRNSLLIYGHRRIGKTSIAQALTSRCNLGDDTKLVYLSLEGPLKHEGDLYYPLAFRFWQRFKENLDKPEKADFDGDNARVKFDSFLAILNESIQSSRCVLILDEFEYLYKQLGPLKADETIKYLRAQIVTYAWLALALVGLSDLNDLRLSYNSSLLGWVGIRVGFLNHEQVKTILANPPQAPDFPLDFTPEALELIAMHTNGQPYLVQVIGDQLVQRYNQMVFVEQREHSGIFNEEDVQEILKDPDFYSTAAAYFDGVWEQATKGQPGEVTLLRMLAKNTDGMDEPNLREVADLDETIFMKSLQALIHHDVLCNKNGRVHYTVPLMYRWVQNMCPKESSQ